MLNKAMTAARASLRHVRARLTRASASENRVRLEANAYSVRKKQLLSAFQNQRERQFNERPIEYSFVFKCLSEIYPTRVLDVGCGETALSALMRTCGFQVTASDNVSDYWTDGLRNWHFHVVDDDICASQIAQSFDAIVCISTLEHIVKFEDAIANMHRLLTIGGHLILTFPYTESRYIPNVYELEESFVDPAMFPFVTQSYCRRNIEAWCGVGLKVLEQEYWQYFTGNAWTVGDEIIPPKKVRCDVNHQLSCILFQRVR